VSSNPVTPADAIERIQRAFGRHPGRRSLHAKGAFYEGTFVASPDMASRCRALHLQGTPVEVLVRLSNGGGNPRNADGATDVRGLAVSFHLPDGTKTDLLGQTAPRFPVRTPTAFVELVEATRWPWRMPVFLARHRDAIGPLVANARAKAVVAPRSYAEVAYYPIHAYRWTAPDGTESWVRYTFRPLATPDDRLSQRFDGPDRLRDEIVARLAAGPVRFRLEVQVADAGDDPHDPMSVWRSTEVLDAGTLTIVAPVDDPEESGKVVVFDPTRVVDGIGLSDDPILRFRPDAYSVSVDRRISESRETTSPED
jgi:catalase